MTAPRIAALRLVAADPERLTVFYLAAFGAEEEPGGFRIGAERVEVVPGRPGPDAAPNAASFQHFAMVVRDMDAAMAALRGVPGWRAISRDGPVTLPKASGGVTAFKFRDPEGHPLEFLAFPRGAVPEAWQRGDGPILGIDHTAIAVADTPRSLAFYAGLGFGRDSRNRNRGPEQARLDGLSRSEVDVTGLEPPPSGPPHVELLGYQTPAPLTGIADPDDTRATRIVLDAPVPEGAERVTLAEGGTACRDPDGHILVFAG